MLPLFSPAISVVVYIFGNTCWPANASDSNSPPFTRSRTFSSSRSRDLSRCRLIKRSSAVRIGSPAFISVRNCWLKIRNVDCRSLPRCPPVLRMVRGLTQYTRYPCCVNRSWTSASEYPCSTCCRRWPCSSATLTRNCGIRYRLILWVGFSASAVRPPQTKSNILFPKRLPQPAHSCGTQVTRASQPYTYKGATGVSPVHQQARPNLRTTVPTLLPPSPPPAEGRIETGCRSTPDSPSSLQSGTPSSPRPPPVIRCGQSGRRSEEHTSELQRLHLVCRLLLEKKNTKTSM